MTKEMPDITDIANWFLSKTSIQHKKLQKLSYYAVSWGYALLDSPICKNDEFEAWIHGPVSPILYDKYKNCGWVPIPQVNAEQVPPLEDLTEDVLEFVWESYGELTQFQLENLTHSETPWRRARSNIPEFDRSNNLIDINDMKSYYRELFFADQND
ncbi:MAG: DUF4065 domain-containing protein [Methanimicrococcus sp.]|nr:DUF4065 domain-containing protein [Methanimicrococcus sp.]